jgi:hypothetical protein
MYNMKYMSRQIHDPAALPPEQNRSAQRTEGWVVPMVGLYASKKTEVASHCRESKNVHPAA